jgi:hypothetical protein
MADAPRRIRGGSEGRLLFVNKKKQKNFTTWDTGLGDAVATGNRLRHVMPAKAGIPTHEPMPRYAEEDFFSKKNFFLKHRHSLRPRLRYLQLAGEPQQHALPAKFG